jgi:hypothetical protein
MVFNNNQKTESGNNDIGDNHPPKKHITIINESHSILLYSAKKNKANVIAEYSTLKPATNSASASGKSNGALLVSASNEIKKITQFGNKGKQYHVPIDCCFTISIKLNEFAQIAIGSNNNPIDTSYDIS